jgi:hypothetical protein
MKRKRTEITIETYEIWIIRSSNGRALAWCPECGREVSLVTAEDLAVLTVSMKGPSISGRRPESLPAQSLPR